MPRPQGPASRTQAYRGVIVGIQTETATVESVWLQRDGGMSGSGYIHYPLPGHTAAGEALLVFGLTRFRVFRACDQALARAYAIKLDHELDDDTPEIM